MNLIGIDTKQDHLVKVKSNFVYNSEETEVEDANPDERERFNKSENRKRIFKKIITGRWMSRK